MFFNRAKQKNDTVSPQHEACVVCGGTSYAWGSPRLGRFLRFVPYIDPRPFHRQEMEGIRLMLRVCKTCGNTQMFVRYLQDLEPFSAE